jgi:hypothetical protein
LICAPALGYAVSFSSPYGVAAFFGVNLTLGVVGCVLNQVFYGWVTRTISGRNKRGATVGSLTGLISYPVTALIFQPSEIWPTNMFALALLGYLLLAGLVLGLLITVLTFAGAQGKQFEQADDR